MTYHPPNPPWMNEPLRMNGVFASKTQLRSYDEPLTAHLDFLANAEQLKAQYGAAPGSHGLRWPSIPQEPASHRDPGLDEFSNSNYGTLETSVLHSTRKYASSFESTSQRGKGALEGDTPPALGPGAYDMTSRSSVRVHDPKRASSNFKSANFSTLSMASSVSQPPDNIQSIQSAILMKHWTSKGVAFSTRERFPKQRARWKD